jgi:hypothetical protein
MCGKLRPALLRETFAALRRAAKRPSIILMDN